MLFRGPWDEGGAAHMAAKFAELKNQIEAAE
jgi:hypothetical protein